MALKGDLASVDLAQVFQMFALNRKVGMLSIQSPRTWRALYFNDHGVTLYYNEHTLLDRILASLVHSGQLAETSVHEVRDDASKAGGSLVDSLLAGGYLSEEDLDARFRSELEEDIYDLFFWKDARFEFFEGATSFEGREGVINERFTFATDMLIMEAARRIDEWDYIRERIPGALEVYRSVGGNSDLDETTAAIYDLVDGKRNVARLVEILGMAPFHTYKGLAQLLDEGMLEALPVGHLVSAGKHCAKEDRLQDAINLFEKAIAVGEGIPEAHILASEAYENSAEYELTVYHLKCVAEYHASEGHRKQAVETLRKAIDIVPTDLAARERLVELTVGHPEFKTDTFDPAVQGKVLVDFYLEVGEVERVRGILERLLRENPMDLELKKILINVHTKAGDTKRVIELYQSIAEDLVLLHRPIEAVKYLQKILMLDRSRADVSDRIRSLYELDERRRSRKRSLLALGLLFCILSVLGAVYYMYDQHARAKFEGLDVAALLKGREFAQASAVYEKFMSDFPFTTVTRDAQAELARIQSQRNLHEARLNLEHQAEEGRTRKLRIRYRTDWARHKQEFTSGDPEAAMRTVEEVLRLVQEAGQAEDLEWAREHQVAKTYEELKGHLSEAAALDRRARDAWQAGDWRTARLNWLKLVSEYDLTSTAKSVQLPVYLASKPAGARILKDGKPLTRKRNGQTMAVVTPAVILCGHSATESFSLDLSGFEPRDVEIDARRKAEFEFVLKVIPYRKFEFGELVRTAAGTDGVYAAVGLRNGKVGIVLVSGEGKPRTVSLGGLSAASRAPVVAGGRIFFVTNEGNLQSLVVDPSVGEPWIAQLKNPPAHQLEVRHGRVFFVDVDGQLQCYDQTNGSRPRWSKPVGGNASGRPIVDGGEVYVGVDTGRVRIFMTSGEPIRDHRVAKRICTPVFPVGSNVAFGCTDGTLRVISKSTGREQWKLNLGRALRGIDIAVAGDTLLVLAKNNRLLRVDPEARSVVAEVELPHPLHFAPVVAGNRVFAVVRRDEGRGKFVDLLRAWRTEDLSLLWEYEDGKPFKGAVSTDGRSAYLPDSSGRLLRFR